MITIRNVKIKTVTKYIALCGKLVYIKNWRFLRSFLYTLFSRKFFMDISSNMIRHNIICHNFCGKIPLLCPFIISLAIFYGFLLNSATICVPPELVFFIAIFTKKMYVWHICLELWPNHKTITKNKHLLALLGKIWISPW